MERWPLFLFLVISTSLFGFSPKRPFAGWAIIQGPSTEIETVFAVQHKKNETVSACVGIPQVPCSLQPKETIKKSSESSDSVLTHFRFQITDPDPEYTLLIKSNFNTDERRFSMLKDKVKLKFAVVSCMDDSLTEVQRAMWSNLLAKTPDVIFFIGDNVYADKFLQRFEAATPNVLWRRYFETRESLDIFRAKKLIPIYATWDDHDYGSNDGNSDYPFKIAAKDTFFAFFPQYDSAVFQRGPGVASILQLAKQDFIFLDDRTFRSKDKMGDLETHWGMEQEDWLWKRLKSNKSPTWLINGDQFFGAYHKFESYEGRHPVSFKKFLKELATIGKPVNFISGDRHLTEIMKIEKKEFGREAYEFTSSGIHAAVFPDSWSKSPNPRQLDGVSGAYNYMIIESTLEGAYLKSKATAYGQDKVFFSREFQQKN